MNTIGKIPKKALVVSIFVTFLLFSAPERGQAYAGVVDVVIDPTNLVQNTVSATANPVTAVSSGVTAAMTTAEKIKEYVLDPVARAIVKTIIQRLTAQTVNWINSGFKGNPAFVTNPDQFFLGVADNTASQFLSDTRLNAICSPFKSQVRLALVKNYLMDNNNYSCTLSTLKNNYEQFTQDFSQGGWQGWFEMTQNNQNNPYGAYLQAQNQLAIQVGTQQNKYQKQLDLGKGFLNFEKCKKDSVLTQADIDKMGPGLQAIYKVGDCYGNNMETVTPGSVIESQLENALGTGVRQLELTRSFDEIVSALVTQLFTRVVGGGSGLRGPSDTLPPEPKIGAPFLNLNGETPMYVMVKTYFKDPGASAFDSTEGDISKRVQASGGVDINTLGTYTVTYSVVNSKGVSAEPVTRTVIVNATGTPHDDTSETECVPPPTPTQQQQAQEAIDFMIPLLNAVTPMSPVVTPPTQVYKDAVQAIVDQANIKYPNLGIVYVTYSDENVIAMTLNYIVGPGTVDVSNIVPKHTDNTWINAWRVTCTASSGGGPTCSDSPNWTACKTSEPSADLVLNIKNYLISRGINVGGTCGGFEIVKRVAWILRDKGAGYLATYHSSKCSTTGMSGDLVAFPDGSTIDILSLGTAADPMNNIPGWTRNPGPPSTESTVYYVGSPTDPGDPSGSY